MHPVCEKMYCSLEYLLGIERSGMTPWEKCCCCETEKAGWASELKDACQKAIESKNEKMDTWRILVFVAAEAVGVEAFSCVASGSVVLDLLRHSLLHP